MFNSKLPILSQDAGLVKYLDEIKKFPILNEEEEKNLAIAWYDNQDKEAAQKLVTSHLRLVAKIAMQFRGYGLPIGDIISEGNIGLMIAVKKFNPYKGYRLSTYAMWWIKATIQDYILKSWSLLKTSTSAAHKKLFFNLKSLKNKILHANQGQIPYNENEIIAKELDVSIEDVKEMNERFSNPETSLNAFAYNDDNAVEVIDTISEPAVDVENDILEAKDHSNKVIRLNSAMNLLDDRERDIISQRMLLESPTKLEDLSQKYKVSKERIRQIESNALNKLKKIMNNQ